MSHEYTLIVNTSPKEGQEAEYNDWYDNVHLPEFLTLPGVVSGRRYKVLPATDGKPVYTAIYQLTEDPDKVLGEMSEGISNGTLHMSDAIDMASTRITKLEPHTP
jgi:hypothetical protein